MCEYDNNLGIGVNTEITDQQYTGEPITPEVAVNDDGGEPLVLDKDYTLTYTNNTKKQLSISGKVGKQSYSSSNKKVTTVNGKGNITAKKL